MIRDRGKIKWTSMMLPEHVKMLRDWAEEDSFEKRRELDEQEFEMMNEVVTEAMEYSRSVMITHYERKQHRLLIGEIQHADSLEGKLRVVDCFGEVHAIRLADIADIRIDE
ncbi:YolD-like family protein [Rossellomorea marisflavi]|uniref:YolD-like family protein n=1 Tax=Rossellomorea marisflavi TaxID=189381 RepID=UPI0009A61909|nr:YolD-like family protein [Rossellomorea marisflavi]